MKISIDINKEQTTIGKRYSVGGFILEPVRNTLDDLKTELTSFKENIQTYNNANPNDLAKSAVRTLVGLKKTVPTDKIINTAFGRKYSTILDSIETVLGIINDKELIGPYEGNLGEIVDKYQKFEQELIRDKELATTLDLLIDPLVDTLKGIVGPNYKKTVSQIKTGANKIYKLYFKKDASPKKLLANLKALNDLYAQATDKKNPLFADVKENAEAYFELAINRLEEEKEVKELTDRLTDDDSRKKYIRLALKR